MKELRCFKIRTEAKKPHQHICYLAGKCTLKLGAGAQGGSKQQQMRNHQTSSPNVITDLYFYFEGSLSMQRLNA